MNDVVSNDTKPCMDCGNDHAGSIERNERCVVQLISTHISGTESVVVLKVRGEDAVDRIRERNWKRVIHTV